MKADPRAPVLRLSLGPKEIVIDNFAGGGGASSGIDAALATIGRHVDIAVNHDPEAIALHKINHPKTKHYTTDVFHVDIVKACRGRPVGLAWYSPDCTFHSKARGGQPFRDRNKARRIRGLAWIIIKQAKELIAAGTPIRVIAMENVQEFADWGPLDDEGKIIAVKKGMTFRRWCRQLCNLGYEIDMWELKGCDYGAPTTRERLFIVARFDKQPIVKPEPTHGAGRAKPWRTAAECIDWGIPCPSIFGRKKPLADNTLRRIAEGIKRFVVNNPSPFIVPVAHSGDARANAIQEPLRTVTGRRGDFALVDPFLVRYHGERREGEKPRVASVDDPLPTQTAENRFGVVEPFVVRVAHGERDASGKKRGKGQHSVEEPLPTQTASNDFALVEPFLVGAGGPGYSGKPASSAQPLGATLTENHRAVVTPVIARIGQTGGNGAYVNDVSGPLTTITSKAEHLVVAPVLVPRYGEDKNPKRGGGKGQAPRSRSVELPLPTIVTTDNGAQVVEAFLLKQNGVEDKMVVGQDLAGPVHTITTRDQKAVVTSHLLKFKGTSKHGQRIDEPLHTVQAGGHHYAEVRAFLIKFYSSGGQWGNLKDPMSTVTPHDRLGLVTIAGEDYQIVDIGLRMLSPRELFRAQGFSEDYKIAVPYNGKPLTKTAQVRMCGNSVCPPVAEAIVLAQLGTPAHAEAAA